MGWFRRRSSNPPSEAATSPLAERISTLESDLRALRRTVDDLDDNLRSFKGRVFKREAREAQEEGGSPSPAGANGEPPSVLAMMKAGRWPFHGR